VFENRVLRGIFGPDRDEIIRGWRKFHNEELHNLYSSPNIITMIKSRALLEKTSVVQPLKNFATFYGTRGVITVFTRALLWSLS
jgi:hypothetical protein